jgi:hypothetical protein
MEDLRIAWDAKTQSHIAVTENGKRLPPDQFAKAVFQRHPEIRWQRVIEGQPRPRGRMQTHFLHTAFRMTSPPFGAGLFQLLNEHRARW